MWICVKSLVLGWLKFKFFGDKFALILHHRPDIGPPTWRSQTLSYPKLIPNIESLKATERDCGVLRNEVTLRYGLCLTHLLLFERAAIDPSIAACESDFFFVMDEMMRSGPG